MQQKILVKLKNEQIEVLKAMIFSLFPEGSLKKSFNKIYLEQRRIEELRESEPLQSMSNWKFITHNELKDRNGINILFFDDWIEIQVEPEIKDRYLSIDLGLKNPVTMVDSETGECRILGRDYMSRSYYFDKEILKLRNIYIKQGLDSLNTKKMNRLVKKKENTLNDILHKITRFITNYCVSNQVTQVIVGDIEEPPRSPFPYNEFFRQMEKKLKPYQISVLKQSEAFTSQVPPEAPEVSKEFANKGNRILRGLFKSGQEIYNADGLAAFNILKSYLESFGKGIDIPLDGIKSPVVITVSD